MNILLTGAFGNVGQSALDAMADEGHRVVALDVDNRRNRRRARQYSERPGIEIIWGDIRDRSVVERASSGCDVVAHLAFVIPPLTDVDPTLSEQVNVGGTRHVLEAAAKLSPPARVLFVSTFDLFGRTQDKQPPRRVTDPVVATDTYTAHKLQCEELVQGSGLDWSIVRFADVPIIGFRSLSPIMFELPLANRFEVLHSKDAGLALARSVTCDRVWGRVLLVGGGPSCQVTYRDFLEGMLDAMGLGTLPERAFTSRAWPCDWIDSTDAQQLLDYQHHSFADIMEEVRHRTRVARPWIRAVSPIARWFILRGSPYLRESRSVGNARVAAG